MLSQKFTKKILLLFQCVAIFLILMGCSSQTPRFGVIFLYNSDIYRIPDDTQGKVEQLTFTPTIREYGLLVSKNGDRIVFDTDFYAGLEMEPSELAIEELRHIYLLDTASKKLIDITNVLEDEFAQIGPNFFRDWSPDQKQFMLIAYKGGGYEIESYLEFVDFDGKNRKDVFIPITGEIPSLIATAKWSPDAKKVMLTQVVIGSTQQWENPGSPILIYGIENGKLTQLTDRKDGCGPVEWSPNNQKIVAICSYIPPRGAEGISGSATIRILDVENPGQPYEHIGFSACSDPSWSRDGTHLAFVCDKDKECKGLFVVNSNGNGIHEVKLGNLGNPAVLKNPTWSPDGTQIVYIAGSNHEHTNIYAIHLDSSNNSPLTNQDAFYNIVAVYPAP